MCGIAGDLWLDRRILDGDEAGRFCARPTHRGLDCEGVQADGPVALAQRRLSIINLEGSRQPMANEDGSAWIAFKGELYNFRELRPGLERRGHRFAIFSDSGVMLHAYDEHGEGCVARIRGMFAIAIWDAKCLRLFLALDCFGTMPLS